MRWLDGITDSMKSNLNLKKLKDVVKDRGAWWATVYKVSEVLDAT